MKKIDELYEGLKKNCICLQLNKDNFILRNEGIEIPNYNLKIKHKKEKGKYFFIIYHTYRSFFQNRDYIVEYISSDYITDTIRFVLMCISEILIVQSIEEYSTNEI
jgi:hypothetical protein